MYAMTTNLTPTDVSNQAPSSWAITLDESLYALDEEEGAFMKTATGIDDIEELKSHIFACQREAWKVFQYPCIRIFEFARLKLARLSAYPELLKLGKTRNGAIFVDLGCCLGNDLRKLILDGYPQEVCIGVDLRKELWAFGHMMFRSTPESFPVPFIQGDVFDPAFLDSFEPLSTRTSAPPSSFPDLYTLASLNPLRGYISAFFTGAFFHLFTEKDQFKLACKLARMLSPEPGSMLIGVQGGSERRGLWRPSPDYSMYCHNPDSWREMWERVFSPDKVQVKTRLRKEDGGLSFHGMWPDNTIPYCVMEWSVTRLRQ